ncbi:MAG: RpiB/LacA/LacB family sugar-phosphate isomerase, partial [Ilumatobacteraceae bacterium]
ALCNDLYLAEMARSHNNANVLSMGGRVVSTQLAEQIVDKFLSTEFEGGRHERRVAQLSEIEKSEASLKKGA